MKVVSSTRLFAAWVCIVATCPAAATSLRQLACRRDHPRIADIPTWDQNQVRHVTSGCFATCSTMRTRRSTGFEPKGPGPLHMICRWARYKTTVRLALRVALRQHVGVFPESDCRKCQRWLQSSVLLSRRHSTRWLPAQPLPYMDPELLAPSILPPRRNTPGS
jgi:hypothetical protein